MTARRLRALPGCTWSPGWRCCGPGEQVFTAMLDGWGSQQLARKLAAATVAGRQRVVRAFASHAGAYPWAWTPQMVDEWCTDLRTVRRVRRSTLGSYQLAVRGSAPTSPTRPTTGRRSVSAASAPTPSRSS